MFVAFTLAQVLFRKLRILSFLTFGLNTLGSVALIGDQSKRIKNRLDVWLVIPALRDVAVDLHSSWECKELFIDNNNKTTKTTKKKLREF